MFQSLFFLKLKEEILHPYTPVGTVIVSLYLTVRNLERRQKIKDSKHNYNH
jgi:hypothetical protein